jgi:hypothetical protein
MKAASIKELRTELNIYTHKELVDLCLNMAKFKKESKEFLTYLLFEASNEEAFIRAVKSEIDEGFAELKGKYFYAKKKGIRKILRRIKQYIRFSKKKATEVELLLHFCTAMKEMSPSYKRHQLLQNIYDKQLEMAIKATTKLHEDLQFDYEEEIEELKAS